MLAKRITDLEESATIKMAQLSRELKAAGHDVIDLSLGEPDFGTPLHIREAAKKAIDEGYSHYTPVPGLPDLRKAIQNKFQRENGLSYSLDQIVVSTGAKQSIANVMLCMLEKGDEVLLATPYWVSYHAIAQLTEASIKVVSADVHANFKLKPEDLEASISPKTKLFVFSSPSNPTGSIYSKEELEALAAVCRKFPNLYILSDEIYEHIVFDEEFISFASIEGMYDKTITINGVSKAFAMTGWRIGYIGAPLEIAKACSKMQGQFTSGTCAVAQKAAEAALNGSLAEVEKMREAFNERRKLVAQHLNEIPGLKPNTPGGAFYFFPDVSHYFGKSANNQIINNADDLALYILNDAKVGLVSGAAFGDANCIRISYATALEKLDEAMKRVKTSLHKLH